MAIPKFFEFFNPFLEVLSDGDLHTAKDVRTKLAVMMEMSDEDLSQMLPSGRVTTFASRVMWARTYMNKAGLIQTPSKGKYIITDEGRKALASGKKIDIKYLYQYPAFQEFHKVTTKKTGADTADDAPEEEEEQKSPVEILDAAFQQVNDTLASELMDEVMKLSPGEFEKLVVKLLLNMGYGDGIDDAGRVTQLTNDGGIDGIIKEDQLGFSNIYIQAKQWAPDQSVSKPEIQKFVGALSGQQAQKGLFITTARFSSGAVQYADNLLGTKVVLVDGERLTKLMIKHNVGVSIEHVYEVKKVDSDFFAEEI